MEGTHNLCHNKTTLRYFMCANILVIQHFSLTNLKY